MNRTLYSLRVPAPAVRDDSADEFFLPLRGGEVDCDFLDANDETFERQYRSSHRQTVLALYDRLEERGKGYLARARARAALAEYLRTVVAPMYPWGGYLELASTLAEARQHGLWGVGDVWRPVDAGGYVEEVPALAVQWTGRAGQVKLCPDDAREESMRASSLYCERLDDLMTGADFELRYAVFTMPNAEPGFLRADMETIFDRFCREILYARADGGEPVRSINDRRRKFETLKGALATLEAPLSARGDWNVHLNVVMLFSQRPDYKALREAWGANVEFRNVPRGAEKAAMAELVKYPLQAVAWKSSEKTEHGRRRWDARRRQWVEIGPPVIEWPPDAFHEWWTAHKGFRRTRSWGLLYSGKLPLDARDRIQAHTIEWLGKLKLSAARFYAERPMPAVLHEREEERRTRDLFAPPSPQVDWTELTPLQRVERRMAAHADDELYDALAAEQRALLAAEEARLDLILGNKSAKDGSDGGARGPPDTS